MGTNDHTPKASERTKGRRRGRAPREVMHWGMADPTQLAALIERISTEGGYIGLGRNADADCLLLYIKLDDWKERIAIETREALAPELSALLDEI